MVVSLTTAGASHRRLALMPTQLKTLADWDAYYRRRYPIVGTVGAA